MLSLAVSQAILRIGDVFVISVVPSIRDRLNSPCRWRDSFTEIRIVRLKGIIDIRLRQPGRPALCRKASFLLFLVSHGRCDRNFDTKMGLVPVDNRQNYLMRWSMLFLTYGAGHRHKVNLRIR